MEYFIDDAGADADTIDTLYFGNALGGMTENETHLAPKMTTHIGIAGVPSQRVEDACATSSNAFKHAVQAIENGIHDVVLVGGVERCTPKTGVDTPRMTEIFASASDKQYEQAVGITFPGIFALLTKRHMHQYGTTEEQLANVAVKNYSNGRRNPHAHFGKETTVEEVLDSPLIADPFRLMDCCPFSDGASAVLVASPEVAESFDNPIDVMGVGHSTGIVPTADKVSLTSTQRA